MLYSISANIQLKNSEHPYSTKIIEGNKTQLFVSIPYFEGKKISFKQNEELELVYYVGQFQYLFNCEFITEGTKEVFEMIKGEDDERPQNVLKESIPFYELSIKHVQILKNFRKSKRELVEIDALVMDSKGLYYGKILDISATGIRFRTSEPLQKKTVEIHYVDEKNVSVKIKGKVVWSKQGDEFIYYGFQKK